MLTGLLMSAPWVYVRDDCSIRHNVLEPDEVEFIIKGSGQTFEFAFTETGLSDFLKVATVALEEMRETEPRQWSHRGPELPSTGAGRVRAGLD